MPQLEAEPAYGLAFCEKNENTPTLSELEPTLTPGIFLPVRLGFSA